MKPYAYACVAGTFDGIHAGHAALLRKAFEQSERVLIGLTSDVYVSRFRAESKPRLDYAARNSALTRWLSEEGVSARASVVPIDDPFEPAVSDAGLEAIIVSPETYARAEEINRRRNASGRKPLALVVVPMVTAEDSRPISATRVRSGEIDAEGKRVLPEALRPALAQPMGRILTPSVMYAAFAARDKDTIISVGDVTTKTLLDAGIVPSLMVIDHQAERKPFPSLTELLRARRYETHHVRSGPGFISGEAHNRIRELLASETRMPRVLEVEGEEDLLTIPVVLEAPSGSVVYYGQPPIPAWACGPETSGIVEVLVTEDIKRDMRALLDQFSAT